MAKVIVGDKEYSYQDGTRLGVIAKDFAQDYKDDIILARYKGRLTELHKTASGVGELEFITTANKDGMRAYKRSVTLLLQRAIHDVLGDKVNVIIQHSLAGGYYCTLDSDDKITESLLDEIKFCMKEIAASNITIRKYSTKTSQAKELFGEFSMKDKQRLLKYRTSSNINVYDLDGTVDYFYGYMGVETGILKYYELLPYAEGFMLMLPSASDTKKPVAFTRPEKLFKVQQAGMKWGETLGISNVGALNDAIASGKIRDIILSQEAYMERNIGQLAENIANDDKIKFVMIAGPSSSGKTTFSHRLSAQLRALGVTPHPVPLDSYYKGRDQIPLDEFGEKDFESIEGLDIELFNQNMTDLLNGKRVELPDYNFKTGKREYNGKYMQLGPDDVLVIEGIHGLNDRMSYSLPSESKYRVYISAITQLSIDEHNPLSTSDGRLIRRIVRDARTRGTSAADTIAMWDSVRRGEERNIFPFQESADYMFNSALIYEMAVLKIYALPQLYNIPSDHPQYIEAKRLIKLMDYFLPLAPDDIPNNSLVREFIGGSVIDI